MARDVNRSPFPGMDPFLEPYWGDVHARLCMYSADLLRRGLPVGLVPRVDVRTVVEFSTDDQRDIIPDLRVVDTQNVTSGKAVSAVVDEPLIVENELEVKEGFVQIIDALDESRVITVIEFCSPTNKISSMGREKYQEKRKELLEGGVSVVEVDLIRAGRWNLQASEFMVVNRRPGLYYVSLTRSSRPGQSGVYSITLRQRLPKIRVPLRSTDEDAVLDLQNLHDLLYENGSYGYTLDYTRALRPPLSKADQEWASEWLREHL